MIIALRVVRILAQAGITDAQRTESGLQAHPLIFLELQTLTVYPAFNAPPARPSARYESNSIRVLRRRPA
jgi:hypothetical protein